MEARILNSERGKYRFLVIGYGNSLRGDDQAGWIVAEAIATEAQEGVSVISMTQLVPEIAANLAGVLGVAFIDACVEGEQQAVRVQEINVADSDARQSHVVGPSQLLQLAERCFGSVPQAWLITVPGRQFELATEMSSEAHRHVESAIAVANNLIRSVFEDEVTYA
jgi:hydrogenase maturation protease